MTFVVVLLPKKHQRIDENVNDKNSTKHLPSHSTILFQLFNKINKKIKKRLHIYGLWFSNTINLVTYVAVFDDFDLVRAIWRKYRFNFHFPAFRENCVSFFEFELIFFQNICLNPRPYIVNSCSN